MLKSWKNAMRRGFVLLVVVAILLVLELPVTAKDLAGVVTSVSGTWFVDGVKVSLGQKLSVGAVVNAKEPNAKYARIVVMLLDFSELSRICDRKGRCPDPLRLPDVVNRPSQPASFTNQRRPTFWERIVSAINRSREPKFRKTLTRGDGGLSDQVVRQIEGGIDLEPVFSGTVAGKFLINVAASTNALNEPSGWVVERQLIEWTGRGPVILSASNLAPALYKITFAQPRGERSVLPNDVWVLVVEPLRYERLSAEYQKARSAVAGWDRKSDPHPIEVLRAFLADLLSDREP